MDRATTGVYQREARRWQATRGDPTDGLALRFREQVGEGLVADLGCGTGRYLEELGAPVVGLDATEAMLDLARTKLRPLVRGDLEALPFRPACLAGAFARHSYLHLSKPAFPAALRELGRVLRPKGLLMISLIEGEYEGHGLPEDDFPGRYFALWNAGELKTALRETGFTDVKVEILRHQRGGDLLAAARRSE